MEVEQNKKINLGCVLFDSQHLKLFYPCCYQILFVKC